MSGDAVGELKIKVGVELDVDEVKAEQQAAADASVSIWDRAAAAIAQRQQEAQVAAAVELTDRGIDVSGIDDPAKHLAAIHEVEAAKKRAADTAVAEAAKVKKAEEKAAKETKDQWKGAFDSVANYAKWAAAAVGAAAAVFVHSTMESALSVDRQSRSLGLSRREVQQWQYVAGQAGVEADALGQAIGGLAQRANDAAEHGGDAAKRFRDMGIRITDAHGQLRPTNDLMLEAADALQEMGPGAAQTAAAMALFGDQGRQLLPVLSQGRAGVSRLTGEFDELGGGLDDQTIDAVVSTDREMRKLRVEITTFLLPAVRWLLDKAQKITRGMHDWARDTSTARVAITLFSAAIAYLSGKMLILKAEAIATWLATFGPVLLGAAVIALVVGLVDDLITLFEGGDSVIGEFIDALFGVGTAREWVDGLKQGWDDLINSIEYAIDKIKEFVGYDSDVANAGDAAAQRVRVENAGIAADRQRMIAAGVSPNAAVATGSATAHARATAPRGSGTTNISNRRTVTVNGLVSEEQLRPMIESIVGEASGAGARDALDGLVEVR